MKNKNIVFIAKSLDGYIADKNGGLDWLNTIPNPDKTDMGYNRFINRIDAIVMGRLTFDIVCSFDCEWPYTKPVFVMSNTLETVPVEYSGKVFLVKGTLEGILKDIHSQGFSQLYIDGGLVVHGFLKEDLIDELIITTFPVLLGGGIPLFGELPRQLEFEHVESTLFLNAIAQDSYLRKR
nr:dihydrofolate reductase [Bacteroidota bacterium]